VKEEAMSEAPVDRPQLDVGAAIVKAVVMCLILAPFMAFWGIFMLYFGGTHFLSGAYSAADSVTVLLGIGCIATALNMFVIGLGSDGW
jgi:hypothetical protein